MEPGNKLSQPDGRNENTVSPQKSKDFEEAKTKSLTQTTRGARPGTECNKEKQLHRSREAAQQAHSQTTFSTSKDSTVARPPELTEMTETTATARPSRRRGAVVSYAEPNLRDKMRRPTKELIDAVGKNGSRRSSSFLVRESLEAESDSAQGGKAQANPRPLVKENIPADLALADQAAELLSGNGPSNHLLETVSRRRQSRRHSSNPKSSSRDMSPRREVRGDGDLPSSSRNKSAFDSISLTQTDGLLESDSLAEWNNSAIQANQQRETRVAARRKSMMV